ncbi:MAG: hypothetical protein K6G16_06810 [Lachnospiraceae bacterium]|nr:hypothetical protein [Lachnospiraceae bacterium]
MEEKMMPDITNSTIDHLIAAEIARAEVNAKRWALAALIAFVSLSADICISKLKRSARK